jgi:ribosome-associated protein
VDDSTISIRDELFIPKSELTFRASRAGGPGGQHVNTSSTRVELVWDVASSPSVTETQRRRIRSKLANRVSQEGLLQLADASTRSQHRNREAVTDRFRELLEEALTVAKPRRKTKPTRASRERRLQSKKQRSEVKRMRKPVRGD